MKKTLNFLREHCARIVLTAALLVYAVHWGITDIGFIPAFVALVLWLQ